MSRPIVFRPLPLPLPPPRRRGHNGFSRIGRDMIQTIWSFLTPMEITATMALSQAFRGASTEQFWCHMLRRVRFIVGLLDMSKFERRHFRQRDLLDVPPALSHRATVRIDRGLACWRAPFGDCSHCTEEVDWQYVCSRLDLNRSNILRLQPPGCPYRRHQPVQRAGAFAVAGRKHRSLMHLAQIVARRDKTLAAALRKTRGSVFFEQCSI